MTIKQAIEIVVANMVCTAGEELHCDTNCPFYNEEDDYDCDDLDYNPEYVVEAVNTLNELLANGKLDNFIPDNPPLTEDQIRGMVGKPVWVVRKSAECKVILFVGDERIYYTDQSKAYLNALGTTYNLYAHEPKRD